LIVAALLSQSLFALNRTRLGFSPERLVSTRVVLPSTYTAPDLQRLFQGVLDERRGTSQRVGLTTALPMVTVTNLLITPEGSSSAPTSVAYEGVNDGYLEMLGVPLVAGAPIDEGAVRDAARVAVVNESLARRLWPGASPIGRSVQSNRFGPLTVIGIVGDVRRANPIEEPTPQPAIYAPFTVYLHDFGPGRRAFTMITSDVTAPMLRRALVQRETRAAVTLRTLDDIVSTTIARQALQTRISVAFAFVAILLSQISMYGLVQQILLDHRRDLGIRVAFGAQPHDIYRFVLRSTLLVALVGVLVGLGGAFAASRVLGAYLFSVRPTNFATYAWAVACFASVCAAACWLPTRRAALLDPVTALRNE
jgi:hypothetical protein